MWRWFPPPPPPRAPSPRSPATSSGCSPPQTCPLLASLPVLPHLPASMSNTLIILSVNVRKSHKDLETILETTLADVLLVQEPSWVCLVPLRSDTNPLGEDTRGSVNHPKWNALFPPMAGTAPTSCPLVTIFLCKSSTHSFIVSILPSFSSLTSLGINIADPDPASGSDHALDGRVDLQTASANGSTTEDVGPLGPARETGGAIMVDESLADSSTYAPYRAPVFAPPSPVRRAGSPRFTLHILNFYHHIVRHHPSLLPLLSFTVDDSSPTLLGGDFNTHSPLWSPPDVPPSRWHDQLEEWLDASGVVSTVPTGAITHRAPGTRPSLINHIFVNHAFLAHPDYPAECVVSFDYTVGSDHAGLLLTVPTAHIPSSLPPPTGWKVDPLLRNAWASHFRSLPIPPISDVASLHAATDRLLRDLAASSDAVFAPKTPPSPHGLAWWDDTCKRALADTTGTHGDELRLKVQCLRATIKRSKTAWYEALLDNPDTNLWDLAKWRHGRRRTTIPPLSTGSAVTSDPSLMATIFHHRFFDLPAQPSPAPPDLPQLSPRPFYPVTTSKIATALANTSNTSAPGPSGINYLLLKWCFAAQPEYLTMVLQAALRLGVHPWHLATVVIIPKPNKLDYLAAKAYRPISLLKCCGKLLEKVVANRLSSDVNHFDLLGPGQFGSRTHHSAPDAATALRHKAEQTIKAGRVGAVLLFDISRFFDHLDPALTVHTLSCLGVDPHTCDWVRSFMADRSVRLAFNGYPSDSFPVDQGTPQGSPLSPILSAHATSPLLRSSYDWEDVDLSLYVDDGNIYASGPTYLSAVAKISAAWDRVRTWLSLAGLAVDFDKTEFMFFHPTHFSPRHLGLPPTSILLSSGPATTHRVSVAQSICYLGVFFTPKLNWSLHVRTMSCHVQSLVHALGILRNSIWGLKLVPWRKVFHAVLIPVLTYASQVWFTDIRQTSLLTILQTAQNDACRKLSGVFRTTPVVLT